MSIKKLRLLLMAFLLMGSSFISYAGPGPSDGTPDENSKATAQRLMVRLHEIKELAKTDLSPDQKTDLRNEVKSIRKQLKSNSKGIYLSVGAIIIILLILILLLR